MDLQNMPWWGQFLVVLLIVGLVGGGSFYYFYYDGSATEVEKIEKQIDGLNTEIRRAQLKVKDLDKIKAEVESIRGQLNLLKNILPEEKDISSIIKQVQGIIAATRMRNIKFVQKPNQKKQIYTEIPLDIVVEANYHNLGIFFDQLSKITKLFTVNNLKLVPRKLMTSEYTVEASFTATTYTYVDAPIELEEPVDAKKGKSRRKTTRGGKK
jgi:type IV pilus assembly protein PilO